MLSRHSAYNLPWVLSNILAGFYFFTMIIVIIPTVIKTAILSASIIFTTTTINKLVNVAMINVLTFTTVIVIVS